VSLVPAISTDQLTKCFGAHSAVDGVTLQVRPGEIFGFLGANGAGKTTTIMMLLGILPPSNGSIRILGQEMGERSLTLKTRIGVVSEHQSLYGEKTAEEYLAFFADLYAVPNARRRIGDLLAALDLEGRRGSRVKTFSRGMQQKLATARALLHSPELLVMDEPASGLDPYGISQIRELINEQKRQGRTVFLSSHLLSEIEQTADRVAIIARGRIVSEGSMADIRRELSPDARYVLEYEGDEGALRRALRRVGGLRRAEADGTKLVLSVASGEDARGEISRAVAAAGGVVLGLTRQEMSLEEAFLAVTEDGFGRMTETN